MDFIQPKIKVLEVLDVIGLSNLGLSKFIMNYLEVIGLSTGHPEMEENEGKMEVSLVGQEDTKTFQNFSQEIHLLWRWVIGWKSFHPSCEMLALKLIDGGL